MHRGPRDGEKTTGLQRFPDVFPGVRGGGHKANRHPDPSTPAELQPQGKWQHHGPRLLSTHPRPGTHSGPSLGNENRPPGQKEQEWV